MSSAAVVSASSLHSDIRIHTCGFRIRGFGLSGWRCFTGSYERMDMIVFGIILLLIGYFTGISILYTIGGILLVIGVVLWILGAVGRPVGGRKVWY
jgi:hypothetical protein